MSVCARARVGVRAVRRGNALKAVEVKQERGPHSQEMGKRGAPECF